MRQCTKCGQEKPRTDFYVKRAHKDGLSPWCKACSNACTQEWALKNPKKRKAIRKKRAAAHSDYHRDKSAVWAAANPEAVNERSRRYYTTDKGRANTRMKNHRRRVRMRGYVSPDAVPFILSLFDGSCAWCLKSTATVLDHIVPIAKGGIHSVPNLTASCVSCNAKKKDRMPDLWAALVGADLHEIFSRSQQLDTQSPWLQQVEPLPCL